MLTSVMYYVLRVLNEQTEKDRFYIIKLKNKKTRIRPDAVTEMIPSNI